MPGGSFDPAAPPEREMTGAAGRVLTALGALAAHWRRRPGQLAAALAGLAAATALWSGVQALNAEARASYDRAAEMLGGAAVRALEAPGGARFSQSLFVDLRRAGWAVSPVIEGRALIDAPDGPRPLRILGIEPLTAPRAAASGLVAGFGAASEQGAADLADFMTPPGLSLIAPETLADLGLEEGARPRVAGRDAPPLRAAPGLAPGTLTMDIGAAQALLRAPGELSRLLVAPDARPSLPALRAVAGDALAPVSEEARDDLARLTDSFHLNLTAMGLLSFLVGLFIAHSAVGLAFEQRLGAVRTLRAIGLSNRALAAAVLIELVFLALIGGALGLGAGYAMAAALLPDVAASLRGLYGAELPGRLSLDPLWLLSGLAMSVAGALAAASGGLWRLARLPLLAAARPTAWREAQERGLRWSAGAAALAAVVSIGALAFGSGLTAAFISMAGLLLAAALALPPLLAIGLAIGERRARAPLSLWVWADARRELSGLSLALMALLLALGVNIGVGSMVSGFRDTFHDWLDARLAAEIYLNAGSEDEAGRVIAFLEERPEVRAILPGWSAEIRFRGAPVEIGGLVDHATYREGWPMLEAAPAPWDRLADGTGALISEQLARRDGLGLGDALDLAAPAGPWSPEIVGIYSDYGNPRGQIRIGHEALVARWPDLDRTLYGLRVAPEAAPGLIAELGARFDFRGRGLIDQASLKAFSKGIFERTFMVTSALNGLTLAVAGIALLASLLTLGVAGAPHLAPLWAMGATRATLARLQMLKMLALAAMTAVLAIPFGVALAWHLVAVVQVEAFGWRLPLSHFPLQWAALGALALGTAALAALGPAIRLARTPPAALLKVFADER